MRQRKDWSSLNVQTTMPVPSANVDQLLTAKECAIREAVVNLKPITKFASIGAEIGYSRQYVSKKMQERFKSDPAALWLQGDDWRIPRKTAEVWIREVFGS